MGCGCKKNKNVTTTQKNVVSTNKKLQETIKTQVEKYYDSNKNDENK
jgi:hypothetical protein